MLTLPLVPPPVRYADIRSERPFRRDRAVLPDGAITFAYPRTEHDFAGDRVDVETCGGFVGRSEMLDGLPLAGVLTGDYRERAARPGAGPGDAAGKSVAPAFHPKSPRLSSRTTRACTMRVVPPIVHAAIEVIIGDSR